MAMRFRIGQCLCGPSRHTILAMAVNAGVMMTEDAAIATLKTAIRALLEGRGTDVGAAVPRLDPWCGLCGAPARAWVYEVGWTREFLDWEVAQRALRQCEAEQRATAAILDLLDESFNARMRREVARHVDEAHS